MAQLTIILGRIPIKISSSGSIDLCKFLFKKLQTRFVL